MTFKNYPETLYITPECYGDTVIDTKEDIISLLLDLKNNNFCYDTDFDECGELEFISLGDGFAFYTTKGKFSQIVKITKSEFSGFTFRFL